MTNNSIQTQQQLKIAFSGELASATRVPVADPAPGAGGWAMRGYDIL